MNRRYSPPLVRDRHRNLGIDGSDTRIQGSATGDLNDRLHYQEPFHRSQVRDGRSVRHMRLLQPRAQWTNRRGG